MHLASTTGAPVSTTTCPVLGDTCLVSVPGRPIADVVNLQVNVGLHTAVLVTIKAKFNKTFVCVPFKTCKYWNGNTKIRRCGTIYFIITVTVVLLSKLIYWMVIKYVRLFDSDMLSVSWHAEGNLVIILKSFSVSKYLLFSCFSISINWSLF